MLPEKISEVHDWLNRAREDLQLVEHLHATRSFSRAALFFSQQATEKALKSFLVWHDHPFRRTHDLVELVRSCADVVVDFATLEPAADRLTPYAVIYRYPGTAPEPTTVQVAEALQAARDTVQFVLDRLPPDVRP